jgi:hypothetical protein
LLTSIVASYALHVSVRHNLQSITGVALVKFFLFIEDLLDGISNEGIQFLDKLLLLLVFIDTLLHVAIRLVDDLLVELQLNFLALEELLLIAHLDRVEVEQLVLVLKELEFVVQLVPLLSD